MKRKCKCGNEFEPKFNSQGFCEDCIKEHDKRREELLNPKKMREMLKEHGLGKKLKPPFLTPNRVMV